MLPKFRFCEFRLKEFEAIKIRELNLNVNLFT